MFENLNAIKKYKLNGIKFSSSINRSKYELWLDFTNRPNQTFIMTYPIKSLQLDLAYIAEEDRVLITFFKDRDRVDWWLTRRMGIALVNAWIEKLEVIGFPQIAVAQLQKSDRNLPLEHELSLEFDGPKLKKVKTYPSQNTALIQEVFISVSLVDCVLLFKAIGKSTQLSLTRKESHAFLEMIASKAREANWVDIPDWPNWLGGGAYVDTHLPYIKP